jgi:hypothetical protein
MEYLGITLHPDIELLEQSIVFQKPPRLLQLFSKFFVLPEVPFD